MQSNNRYLLIWLVVTTFTYPLAWSLKNQVKDSFFQMLLLAVIVIGAQYLAVRLLHLKSSLDPLAYGNGGCILGFLVISSLPQSQVVYFLVMVAATAIILYGLTIFLMLITSPPLVAAWIGGLFKRRASEPDPKTLRASKWVAESFRNTSLFFLVLAAGELIGAVLGFGMSFLAANPASAGQSQNVVAFFTSLLGLCSGLFTWYLMQNLDRWSGKGVNPSPSVSG